MLFFLFSNFTILTILTIWTTLTNLTNRHFLTNIPSASSNSSYFSSSSSSNCTCGLEGISQRIVGGEDSMVIINHNLQTQLLSQICICSIFNLSHPEWKISLDGCAQLFLNGRLKPRWLRSNSYCLQLGRHCCSLHSVSGRLFSR